MLYLYKRRTHGHGPSRASGMAGPSARPLKVIIISLPRVPYLLVPYPPRPAEHLSYPYLYCIGSSRSVDLCRSRTIAAPPLSTG